MGITISDMKVGTQLLFGKYGVNNDAPRPIIWLKATPNNDFITLNTVDCICFDAKETTSPYYRYMGNPKYKLRNIHSFLNSDAEDWFNQTHQEDDPPRYNNHFGFLYHFEEYEVESIKPETFEVDNELITSLMRLPSIENILGTNRFKVFSKKGIRPKATEDMLTARFYNYSHESYIPFWLNDSPLAGQPAMIGRSGRCERTSACNCSGLRPVCTINQDVPVLEREDGIYYIEPRAIHQNVCADDELLAFLGMI